MQPDIFADSRYPQEEDDLTDYGIRLQLRRLTGAAGLLRQFRNYAEKADKVFWLERFKSWRMRGQLGIRFFKKWPTIPIPPPQLP